MKKFKVGDRVKLSKEWRGWWVPKVDTGYFVGRPGVVIGNAVDQGVVRVRFDGNKTATAFHTSFLSKTRKKAA